MKITDAEIEVYRLKIRKLSNRGEYKKAYTLASSLVKKYPHILIFAYYEAVMTAEDDFSFSKKQVKARYKLAARKLRKLLPRMRGSPLTLRTSLKNEYYWFSKQPRKQYLLGVSEVAQGRKRGGYYSQGVGAAMLAKNYALNGKPTQAIKWAKKSEYSWIQFFKQDSNWFNSYFFYAMPLGFQNRLKDSNKAYEKAAKIAKKSLKWKAIQKEKKEMMIVHNTLYGTKNI